MMYATKSFVSPMMFRLFLIFTILPAVELFLLFRVSDYLGSAETVLLIIVTGILGSYMARQEGGSVLKKLITETQSGRSPAKEITEGVMILAGGLLLVTPGVVTDFIGFSLIIPITRNFLATPILNFALDKMSFGSNGSYRKNFDGGFVDIGPMKTPSSNTKNSKGATFQKEQTTSKPTNDSMENISIVMDEHAKERMSNSKSSTSKFKDRRWSHPIADDE
jgi:UPF0716 protein FxsA